MTSIVKLHAFSGVMGESPPCYLLQVDEFRFLLDCGWDEDQGLEYTKELKKHLHQIDAVLLSHPDYLHLGALPHLVGKAGLSCPIYATVPVYKMGQMFMYDLYQSRHNTEDFDVFTLDDVDAAFDKIIQLKYSQTVTLRGKGQGLQITPISAGHMIGGTIWKIVKDGEEEIIYAVDYNHKKERHLNGCDLESISRPSLLITDALNITYQQARRRNRDEQLMTNILQTMRRGGNALVTVDTAGRVLELAQLLDQLWRNADSGLMAYSLALLNNVSYNVVEFAKSQVEWMSDKIMRAFEDKRNNPFQFRHVQLCHSLGELSRVPEPKVVLASIPDMQSGFSRDIFLSWCANPKNSVILTCRTKPGTLARQLIDNPQDKHITLEVQKRVRLEGKELEDYVKRQKEKEQAEAALKIENAKKATLEADSSDESDMEVDEEQTNIRHDLMAAEGKSKMGFFKTAKKSYPMFPFTEERIRWDDYGEIVRHEDFMIAEAVPTEEETKENGTADVEPVEDISEVPTKCVSSTQTVDINASVNFIDFEGRSDGESIKKILNQIKPKQVVIVRGNPDATEALAEFCRSTPGLLQGGAFTPALHETVDATTEGFIFQVKLKDSLVSALQIYRAKDIELAWVDAKLDVTIAKTDTSAKYEAEDGEFDDSNSKQAKTSEEDDEDDIMPTLLPLPYSEIPGHMAVFINEPKLSDLKTVMVRAGIQAEFSGGVLICNNIVAIRRNETGRIQLEGCISDDYYKVRDILYDQYAIV
ncbi:cleavage and polyadenylation specificity factor subunit 2-like [Tubulanus polymorphus]|uniref:cleavage and polyadenylation specificity factor subunit 2-like n=1 Tax=Tubulanus polymorphus TaxID=672921 RepID=UPI003DA42D5B